MNLENMYYILASLGSIATVVAIFVAISIPKKIAKQQSRITLFDKRYVIYNEILKIQQFKESLTKSDSVPEINRMYFYERVVCVKLFDEENTLYQKKSIEKLKKKLEQVKFLFDFQDLSDLEILQKHLYAFIDSCSLKLPDRTLVGWELVMEQRKADLNSKLDKIEIDKKAFIASVDTNGKKLISKMEEELTLNMKKIK